MDRLHKRKMIAYPYSKWMWERDQRRKKKMVEFMKGKKRMKKSEDDIFVIVADSSYSYELYGTYDSPRKARNAKERITTQYYEQLLNGKTDTYINFRLITLHQYIQEKAYRENGINKTGLLKDW